MQSLSLPNMYLHVGDVTVSAFARTRLAPHYTHQSSSPYLGRNIQALQIIGTKFTPCQGSHGCQIRFTRYRVALLGTYLTL
jgi:hypothetical protein